MTIDEQKQLLILEMKRCISILEDEDGMKRTVEAPSWNGGTYPVINPLLSELKVKLREVRRDSIKLEKMITGGN